MIAPTRGELLEGLRRALEALQAYGASNLPETGLPTPAYQKGLELLWRERGARLDDVNNQRTRAKWAEEDAEKLLEGLE